ncbi:MAG TPA: GC-type dockerin domain-anchored protein [Phycisphaerales bacterium]|nr:GC-type dockerin domain-anchored protein [Phycisphaerales bacterium]
MSIHTSRFPLFLLVAAGLALPASALAQANWSESFEGLTMSGSSQAPGQLVSRGWIFRNQSSPAGPFAWYDVDNGDNPILPTAHAGSEYIGTNDFACGTVGNALNVWAILPSIPNQRAGDVVTFHAATWLATSQLEMRYAPAGTSTGSGASGVGDFTTLLGTVTNNGNAWTRHQYTLPGNGRIAFRYTGARGGFSTFQDFLGIDTLSVGPEPTPPCNMPPIPAAGQTVTWTAAGAGAQGYRLCQSVTIPAGATVNVEPGVRIAADPDRVITLRGTLRTTGTAAAPVTLSANNYPPLITVEGGTLETRHTDIRANIKPSAGGQMFFTDTTFTGANAAIFTTFFVGDRGFARFERVAFNDGALLALSDYTAVLTDVSFNNSMGTLLRCYPFIRNLTSDGQGFSTEGLAQGLLLDTIHIRNAQGEVGVALGRGYGLGLMEGNFFIGPSVNIENCTFTAKIDSAGILPGSTLPPTGNTNNLIFVPGGDHGSESIWADAGVPYLITAFYAQHGGSLTVLDGVQIKMAPSSGVRKDPSPIWVEGTKERPVSITPLLDGEGGRWHPWQGVAHFRHTHLDGAFTAAAWPSQIGWGFMDDCLLTNNQVAVYGQAIVRGSLFQNNGTAAQVGFSGEDLLGLTNPNGFENNVSGVIAASTAVGNWWNSPNGPTSPDNPGGDGDPKADGIPFLPFLAERPDFTNAAPQVDIEKHSHIARPGQKVVLTWKARDDGSIASQRVIMALDGDTIQQNLIEPVIVLADNIPGSVRSIEFTMPEPQFRFFGSSNIRVEATDETGRIGWDDTHIYSERDEQGGLTLTSPLPSGQVMAGQNLGPVCWTEDGINPIGGSVNAYILLENTGDWISLGGVTTYLTCLSGELKAPYVSTDRARIVLNLFTHGGINQPEYYFGPAFTIRPDSRVNDPAPTVQLLSPPSGASFSGGSTVPITWAATDASPPDGAPGFVRSISLQASTDNGRTWSFIARDLPGTSTSYNWTLPSTDGIGDVLLKVVAIDRTFQDASSVRPISITAGRFHPPAACPADLGTAGGAPGQDGRLDNNDFVVFIDHFFSADPRADFGSQGGQPGGDGVFDNNDFVVFIDRFFTGCP